jgi:sugar phosphate isomerase/epimerase
VTRASVFTDEISPDFEEAVRTAAAAGVRYVDIRNTWGRSCAELNRDDWRKMADIMKRHDVRLGAVQSPFGKCEIAEEEYQRHLAFLPNLIEQAHFFGTDVIRIFPFWQPDRSSTAMRPNLAPMLPEIATKLRRATRLAEQEGVYLALEPEHSTYSGSLSEIRAIIDAVGSPALRVAWDASNGWFPDEPIVPDGYEQVRGLVVNVHVKDRAFPPDQERERRLPTLLGTGLVPWPEIIGRLKTDGYTGVYSIETHFGAEGPYGWAKLKAATTWYMYALRELLEANG